MSGKEEIKGTMIYKMNEKGWKNRMNHCKKNCKQQMECIVIMLLSCLAIFILLPSNVISVYAAELKKIEYATESLKKIKKSFTIT